MENKTLLEIPIETAEAFKIAGIPVRYFFDAAIIDQANKIVKNNCKIKKAKIFIPRDTVMLLCMNPKNMMQNGDVLHFWNDHLAPLFNVDLIKNPVTYGKLLEVRRKQKSNVTISKYVTDYGVIREAPDGD